MLGELSVEDTLRRPAARDCHRPVDGSDLDGPPPRRGPPRRACHRRPRRRDRHEACRLAHVLPGFGHLRGSYDRSAMPSASPSTRPRRRAGALAWIVSACGDEQGPGIAGAIDPATMRDRRPRACWHGPCASDTSPLGMGLGEVVLAVFAEAVGGRAAGDLPAPERRDRQAQHLGGSSDPHRPTHAAGVRAHTDSPQDDSVGPRRKSLRYREDVDQPRGVLPEEGDGIGRCPRIVRQR